MAAPGSTSDDIETITDALAEDLETITDALGCLRVKPQPQRRERKLMADDELPSGQEVFFRPNRPYNPAQTEFVNAFPFPPIVSVRPSAPAAPDEPLLATAASPAPVQAPAPPSPLRHYVR